jgi:hypothetical protein
MRIENRIQIGTVVMAAALAIGATGCADDDEATDGDDAAVQCPQLGALAPGQAPAAVQPPEGASLVTRTYAVGVQIYTCKAVDGGGYAWTFVAPEATLYNDACGVAGSHGAGPIWTWAKDGSSVTAKKLAEAPGGAGSIPVLLLESTANGGDGLFSDVAYVQRLETSGGLAPTSGCDASAVGEEARIDYTSVYYFWN